MVRTRADSPTKTCTREGCGNPLRARGLCVTHYNQSQPQRHRRVEVPCGWCGTVVRKESGRTNRYQAVFCNLTCRDLWRRQKNREDRLPVLHSEPWSVWGWCDLPTWKMPDFRLRFTAGRCALCGTNFVADRYAYDNGSSRYCSNRCARTAAKDRRRARQRGAYVADVYRREVFERDGWRCQLCRRKVLQSAQVPHPRAATIDHIIPLALGGTHEPVNCQTACFECNCRKTHVGVGDQLRLIA